MRDRLTGMARAMDNIAPLSLSVEMRHDVPRFKSSWGLTWAAAEHGDVYYTDEVLHWTYRATWGAYLETTAIPGVKTTLTGKALSGTDSDRFRRFWAPTRADTYSGSETRMRREGATVSVTMAKSF